MASSRAGTTPDEPGDGERVPAVPDHVYEPPAPPPDEPAPPAAPRADETETEAAERVARESGQDPWGDPEDQPDHDENEVFVQRDAPERPD